MKKNFKNILITIITMFVLTITNIYAVNTISGSQITYDNTNSKLSSTNVQGALDEIYTNINSKISCPDGYYCKARKSSPVPGDYVKMTPTLTSYTTDTSKTGNLWAQTINPSELNLWRVLKVNSNGTVEVISEYTSSTSIYFVGKTGYENLVGYLNVLASKYENSKYTSGSRYVGYNGQTEYITDTSKITSTTAPWTSNTGSSTVESQGGGDTLYTNDYNLIKSVIGTAVANKVSATGGSYYWLASRDYLYNSSDYWYYDARYVNLGGSLNGYSLYYSRNSNCKVCSNNNALRPIVILKSGINYTPATGTSDDPFVLN